MRGARISVAIIQGHRHRSSVSNCGYAPNRPLGRHLIWKCRLDFERVYLGFGISQPLHCLTLLDVLRKATSYFPGIGSNGVKMVDLPHDSSTYPPKMNAHLFAGILCFRLLCLPCLELACQAYILAYGLGLGSLFVLGCSRFFILASYYRGKWIVGQVFGFGGITRG